MSLVTFSYFENDYTGMYALDGPSQLSQGSQLTFRENIKNKGGPTPILLRDFSSLCMEAAPESQCNSVLVMRSLKESKDIYKF